MGFREKLRKAAGILVELPPDNPDRAGPNEAEDPDRFWNQLLDKDRPAAATATGKPAETSAANSGRNPVEAPAASVTAESASSSPASGSAAAAPSSAPSVGGGDFDAIYKQAAVPTTPFTAERMLDMLSRLPAELSQEQKRVTVMTSLDALGRDIGATSETIVADARDKMTALARHIEGVSKETANFVASTSAAIGALQAEMENKRKLIEAAREKETQTREACTAESSRLEGAIKFFGLEAPNKS